MSNGHTISVRDAAAADMAAVQAIYARHVLHGLADLPAVLGVTAPAGEASTSR